MNIRALLVVVLVGNGALLYAGYLLLLQNQPSAPSKRSAVASQQLQGEVRDVSSPPSLCMVTYVELGDNRSYFDKMYPSVASLGIRNILAYSHYARVPFFFQNSHLIDRSRRLYWSKLPVVRAYLPSFQWVLWLDVDVLIANFSLRLTDHLPPSAHVVLVAEPAGVLAGLFFVRNSPKGRLFLDLVDALHDVFARHDTPEQIAMREVYAAVQNGTSPLLPSDVVVVADPSFHLYPSEFFLPPMRYVPGAAILHFPWVCKHFMPAYAAAIADGSLPCGIPPPLYASLARAADVAQYFDADVFDSSAREC